MNKIGGFIRINRLYNNMNLSSFAKLSGLSNSQISKIERNIEYANSNVCKKIALALNIDVDLYISQHSDIKSEFEKIYKILYYDYNKKNLDEKINEFNSTFRTQYVSVGTELLNLIFLIKENNNNSMEIEKNIKLLDSVIDSSNVIYQKKYYTYVGYYKCMHHSLNQGIELLLKAQKINGDSIDNSMINFFLGKAYIERDQILKAYYYIYKSIEDFNSTNNFVYVSLANAEMAKILCHCGEYDDAIKLIKHCMDVYDRLNLYEEEKFNLFIGLIYINIIKGDFSRAYELLEKFSNKNDIQLYNRFHEYILYKLIVLYETNNINEFSSLCLRIKDKCYETDAIDNLILYYCNKSSTKDIRLKYLHQCSSLIRKYFEFSKIHLLIVPLVKESESFIQISYLNEILLDRYML